MADDNNKTAYIAWAEQEIHTDVTAIQARSGAHSSVYELKAADTSWFLKIGDNLTPEYDRLKWLEGKLPAPQAIAINTSSGQEALLMTTVPGIDLAHLSVKLPPDEIIARLAVALQAFNEVNATDCPFSAYNPGDTLVHGDACLPNLIFTDDGELSGYIDLGDMGKGDVEVDLSAAVWSLNYSLGPGHGIKFLKAYGRHDATEEDVERLWQMYATSPIFDK